ncbi:hypothetical protein BJ912DRAFT_996409 [Pholiota molesta]|nr:hypothetical protein BJ912DRAFT_996409 [Pholiota molesta]
MKFVLSVLASALFVGSALAQGIAIGFPADGTLVTAGSSITVEIDRPDTLTPSTDVALVLAIISCRNTTCLPPDDVLGSILYNGPYNPQFSSTARTKPPHQNFTVTIPAAIENGNAQLAAFHVSLVGAGPYPLTQIRNITLIVQ